jgi:hypothetical protein
MGESTSTTSVPAWVWMIAGVILGGVAVSLIAQTPEPKTPTIDTAALKAQQKQLQVLNKRLKRLETRPVAIQKRRIAERTPPASVKPSIRLASKAKVQGQAYNDQEEFAAADNARQEETKVWISPVFEDGHRFDDGVIVDMKPNYPAAADPIPVSARASQDNSAELRAAFPKGCPTCK